MKSVMFRQASTLILIGMLLIVFGSAASAADRYNQLQVLRSNPAPLKDFSFPAMDGQTVSLQEMQGKVVLLAFFATVKHACSCEFATA